MVDKTTAMRLRKKHNNTIKSKCTLEYERQDKRSLRLYDDSCDTDTNEGIQIMPITNQSHLRAQNTCYFICLSFHTYAYYLFSTFKKGTYRKKSTSVGMKGWHMNCTIKTLKVFVLWLCDLERACEYKTKTPQEL